VSEFVSQLSFGWLLVLVGTFVLGWIAATVAIGFVLERAIGASRRIFALPRAAGQLRRELIGNVRFVAMATVAFAFVLYSVPKGEDTLVSFVVTFTWCWLGFEIYYWCMHRAMHTRRGFRFHRYHHDSRVTSPLTGYSMSAVESAGWLAGLGLVPLLLGLMMPISVLGLVAYHALYQIPGNVIGHANVDFFPRAASKRINSWISHPTLYHSLHHARVHNHYSFGSTFMDRLLRTEWSDWPALHTRVAGGTPLRSLSERG
jgi:sterol desaturase/sphingolipid hydroxylase (fatty acid hydroxylase superfamily)